DEQVVSTTMFDAQIIVWIFGVPKQRFDTLRRNLRGERVARVEREFGLKEQCGQCARVSLQRRVRRENEMSTRDGGVARFYRERIVFDRVDSGLFKNVRPFATEAAHESGEIFARMKKRLLRETHAWRVHERHRRQKLRFDAQ